MAAGRLTAGRQGQLADNQLTEGQLVYIWTIGRERDR